MAKRKPPAPVRPRQHAVRHFFGRKNRPPLVQIQWSEDSQGTITKYSLAYIDFAMCSKDNGRVLGYDNAHGYAERHWMGAARETDFDGFSELLNKFHAEVAELRRKHYGNHVR